MWDFSCLEPAAATLVLLADTHHMPVPPDGQAEFASRLRQAARARTAVALAAALPADAYVHLGDLVQSFPDSPDFPTALAEAREGLHSSGRAWRVAPGNHDVGDKPDPTMPTSPVTPQSLAQFVATIGPDRQAFDLGPTRCVLLNSQILNRDLPETAAQWEWLETELAAHAGRRIFLFLHLPPFLHRPDEPDLGHYDNVGEPARSRLCQAIADSSTERVIAAHVHWRFTGRLGSTHWDTAPSAAFTRPGFAHLFSSTSPPEQGRDDTPKLGFLVLRVLEQRSDLHWVRTHGWEAVPPAVAAGRRRLVLTRPPLGLPDSPLGITLHAPVAHSTLVPLAWPSAVRQPVRNDYPFLALLELGCRAVRTSAEDLLDPAQAERLQALQVAGVAVTAQLLWSGPASLAPYREAGFLPDSWEIRLPGLIPDQTSLRRLAQAEFLWRTPVALAPVAPGQAVPGKQHPRTRMAFLAAEVSRVGEEVRAAGLPPVRLVCQGDRAGLAAAAEEGEGLPGGIAGLDLTLGLGVDDGENARSAAS
ncbi:MAG: hypothetical protein FJX77_13865, partial [Armatimonadetes bacterium]|nr:hypothetical protein [Armatimonadota bacterium]